MKLHCSSSLFTLYYKLKNILFNYWTILKYDLIRYPEWIFGLTKATLALALHWIITTIFANTPTLFFCSSSTQNNIFRLFPAACTNCIIILWIPIYLLQFNAHPWQNCRQRNLHSPSSQELRLTGNIIYIFNTLSP